MKPYFPDEMEYKSPDGKLRLRLRKEGRTATLGTSTVPEEIHYPSQALVSSRSGLAFLLGSHGDAGFMLGTVIIIDREGRIVRQVELKDHLPELEKLSRDWSEHGNFEWITSTELAEQDRAVVIGICEKRKAVVHADRAAPDISRV